MSLDKFVDNKLSDTEKLIYDNLSITEFPPSRFFELVKSTSLDWVQLRNGLKRLVEKNVAVQVSDVSGIGWYRRS